MAMPVAMLLTCKSSLMNLTSVNIGVASSGTQSLEVKDRRSGSSSSSTEWTNDGRLNVTGAVSECSFRDDDDNDDDQASKTSNDASSSWCAEALKLENGVREAEHNHFTVHQELVSQKSHHQCVSVDGIDDITRTLCAPTTHSVPAKEEIKGDFCTSSFKNQFKQTVPNLCEDVIESSFAREARGQLQDLPDKNACRVLQDDPTFALEDRLQKLLLTTVLEHEYPVCSGRLFEDAWDTCDRCGMGIVREDAFWKDVEKKTRSAIHSGAHRRELSMDYEEMKLALSSQKKQVCFCCRRYTQQTAAEEMYCKETIRQIMQQVQGEIEQWSHMQDIVHTLQEELEGWSRWQKLWQDRALQAEAQLKCLEEEVHEWKFLAQSSNEELVILRCEKQILKNKIDMMEEVQCMTSSALREVDEKPRCASVGTQHEDFALCESFVHSRNESGRSSVDLGASTQKSFRKAIKKSLDFATGKSISNPSKFSNGSFGITKAESNGIEFSSKKNDVCNSKPKSYGHSMIFNTTKVDSSESTYGHGYKGRKKARLFASKENKSSSTSNSTFIPYLPENAQDSAQGRVVNAGHGHVDCLFSSKPKSSLPSAPASTPSRTPFGDIANLK